MKIFISADIEGIAGITDWKEAKPGSSEYRPYQERMTAEVNAACLGALAAGAKEIWVRDAHWFARNLLHERLPREVRLVRGWSRHPYMMVQELDGSFDAAAFVGYHSMGGSGANPLAHTLTSSFQSVRINGKPVAEFHLYAGAAALEGVPAIFASGDQRLCEEVKAFEPHIETVATSYGHGSSTVSIHPELACERIREGMQRACTRDKTQLAALLHRPQGPFVVEVTYNRAVDAYKNSFYPGAALKSDLIVTSPEFLEVLRMLVFTSSD
jgi:D-amino peptidase